nr:CBS domain-containing protein [Jiangella rhizosphaerae]
MRPEDSTSGARNGDEVERRLEDMERESRERLEDWPHEDAAAGTASPGEQAGGVEPQTVADVMTREVVAVPVAASVADAARAMRDHDIGDVLALDEGLVWGIVTDRDLVVRVLAEGMDPDATTVADVCSGDLVTVRPGDDAGRAVELMRSAAVRRLPVVDDQGRPQGVVSLGDLALASDPRSALADISAAPPNT